MSTETPQLTNQEVGDLIGCTHSMASRLRAGKRLPGLATLEQIHQKLGVPWTDLLAARRAGSERFGVVLSDALDAEAKKRLRR